MSPRPPNVSEIETLEKPRKKTKKVRGRRNKTIKCNNDGRDGDGDGRSGRGGGGPDGDGGKGQEGDHVHARGLAADQGATRSARIATRRLPTVRENFVVQAYVRDFSVLAQILLRLKRCYAFAPTALPLPFRYRGYCSRRLRRLRKTLNFTQFSKHRFQKKKVTKEIITDAKFLQIPLMSAERAWALAMQLKQVLFVCIVLYCILYELNSNHAVRSNE